MTAIERLRDLRSYGGDRQTEGLEDEVLASFLASDPTLGQAIEAAWTRHHALRPEWAERLQGSESALLSWLQADLVNFYPPENVNPFVPLAAVGPWVVTTHGAVLHDNGGYGMLGLGHAPAGVLETMAQPWVMANVMTPSLSHRKFTDALRREIGQRRAGGCPFDSFVCANSGSESVTIATRISDHLALKTTGPGGPRAGARPVFLSLTGSFHGRTGRPAQASHSTLPRYREALASFSVRDNLLLCPPNDVATLREVFAKAEADNLFIEMMFIEPVMGEGNPGMGITREFYDAARALTRAHGSLLIADSIQAGLRGSGYLSLVDYPGFEDAEPPDLETWSKALNAGQYPMSVLGMTERAASHYVRGVYGNTMTTNPRALEVGCAVLESLTPELRANIVQRGAELVASLEALRAEFPDVITAVQGTGLLVSAAVDPERVPVLGYTGLEVWCRHHGLGVIHGGRNSLRFTPHFAITSAEIELIVRVVRQGIVALLGVDGVLEPAREREMVP